MLTLHDLEAIDRLHRESEARLLAAVRALLAEHRPAPHVLLTTEQAAAQLGISRPKLLELLDMTPPAIPYRWAGAHRRISLADVQAYQAAQEAQHGPARPRDPLDPDVPAPIRGADSP